MTTHEQFVEDLPLYAAGALSSEERADMEKHLDACPACRRELEQLRGDAALLALSVADANPPARARQRLMSAIAAEPRGRRASPAPETRWIWAPWAAAAMALLALALWLGNLNLRRELERADRRLARQQEGIEQSQNVLETLSDPNAARFTLSASGAPRQPEGKAIYASARHSLIFLANNLPSPPSRKVYELWLIPTSGAPVPAGVFKPDARGSVTLVEMQGPPLPTGIEAKAFAVTIEPEGGSPAPTSKPILSGSGI